MATADFIPIQTKASRLSKPSAEGDHFKVTVFEPKKAKANRPKQPKVKFSQEKEPPEHSEDSEPDIDDIFSEARKRKRKAPEDPRTFDIAKARKEVINFGISGFDRQTKHDAKVALAIKLGAKPPKNKYRNYKEILEERKRDREESDRTNRRRIGQNFGAAKSFQQHKQRARQKAQDPGSVARHYGVVNPKIGDKKKRKG